MFKVSYVCPIFNKEKYISKVLYSLKSQVGNFKREFIFINDGSTDNSLSILKKITKNWNNTKIISQKNQGPSIATQNGIDSSSGNYLKLVGGDDILTPDCTLILLNAIKKTKSIAVFSKYKLLKNLNESKTLRETPSNIRKINTPLLSTIKSSFSGTSPNLYCNYTVKKSGGCNKKLFVEDFSLVLGIARYGSFSFIDNITAFGPKDDKNRIMNSKKTQLLHDYNAALYYFLKKNNQLDRKIKFIACKKAIGRSEKWARREQKKNIFNKMNFLKLQFFLGRSNFTEMIKESCKYFYKNSDNSAIRYKIT